jgi:UDP-3-O-[3-hydroxymyristoyl] glucosamine N-acyltransferase
MTLFTTGQLAQTLGADLEGPPDLPLARLATLEDAAPGDLTFIRDQNYAAAWAASRASAAIVARRVALPTPPAGRALLRVPDADQALVVILEDLARSMRPARPAPGVHPTAVVHPSASIAPSAVVGPLCVIEPGARVDDGAWLVAQVYLGEHARVGKGSVLYPGVRVYDRCIIGNACFLHSGVVIGADGFGYLPAPPEKAPSTGGILKIPHVGNVEIADLVEIGANSCIDRAKFGSTTVGAATKIDNLVQVGHGCRIGRACLVCGACGLAGSVILEDGVVLAGQVGIKDGVRIGARATILAQSGVTQDVPPGERWWGFPAVPLRQFVQREAGLRKLLGEPRPSARSVEH